jgi:SLT domain-containing protein
MGKRRRNARIAMAMAAIFAMQTGYGTRALAQAQPGSNSEPNRATLVKPSLTSRGYGTVHSSSRIRWTLPTTAATRRFLTARL